jgi:UDP-glucose 4-epimerase
VTWLITGGSGYIGRHIVEEFYREQISVVVFDSMSHDSQKKFSEGFSLVLGDIRDNESLTKLFRHNSFEGVLNLAALKSVSESINNPDLYKAINFDAATSLMNLAVAHGVPYFIQSSSAAVYGSEHNGVVSENALPKPISPYGSSKLKAENYLNFLISEQKISGTSLRYFNVAGSGDSSLRDTGNSNVFPIFVNLLSRGISPTIYGYKLSTKDGTCLRDYIHVQDLASAHTAVLRKLPTGNLSPVINLGSGSETSVLEIYEKVSNFLMIEIEPTLMPEREGDPISLIADIQIARRELGFRPKKSLTDIVRSSL